MSSRKLGMFVQNGHLLIRRTEMLSLRHRGLALMLAATLPVLATQPTYASTKVVNNLTVQSSSCTPHVQIARNWYGISVREDECGTKLVKDAITAGSAASVIASVMCGPAAPACLVLSGAMAASGGLCLFLITKADHGNGVWFNFTYLIGVTITSA